MLILLALLAGVCYGAYWYGQEQAKKEVDARVAELQKQIDDLSEAKLQIKENANTTFTSSDLGLALNYPKEWGLATLKKGEIVSPGTGNYQQLTFAKQPTVYINFVLGPYFSPLDGCPHPSLIAPHDAARLNASTIGWSGSDILMLWSQYNSQNKPEDVVMKANSNPNSDWGGWEEVNKLSEVLTYKAINQTPFKAETEGQNTCVTVSQAEADKANTYYNFIRFVINYKNSTERGVNALIDTSNSENSELQKQLQETLLSVKNK